MSLKIYTTIKHKVKSSKFTSFVEADYSAVGWNSNSSEEQSGRNKQESARTDKETKQLVPNLSPVPVQRVEEENSLAAQE